DELKIYELSRRPDPVRARADGRPTAEVELWGETIGGGLAVVAARLHALVDDDQLGGSGRDLPRLGRSADDACMSLLDSLPGLVEAVGWEPLDDRLAHGP